MEKEHDWLLIGSRMHPSERDGITVFKFRCKGCLAVDESFEIAGPPKRRHMLDECQDDDLHRLKNLARKRD